MIITRGGRDTVVGVITVAGGEGVAVVGGSVGGRDVVRMVPVEEGG